MLDELDRGLVHALQLDGRVPFARIAEVLEVSEHTVARRYRRLRTAGVLRVVGAVDGFRLGYASWTVRLRCTPDAAGAIAVALARRSDTFWVHVLSGGTEISCNLQAGSDAERDGFLLEKLPGTRRVLGDERALDVAGVRRAVRLGRAARVDRTRLPRCGRPAGVRR